MSTEILDEDIQYTEYNKFRVIPLVLEFLPIIIGLIAFSLGDRKYFSISIFCLGVIYLFGGWYLFKTKEHKILNVIISTLAGLFLSSIVIGITVHYMTWKGNKDLLTNVNLIILFGVIISGIIMIIRLISSKKRVEELTMSIKIFSRYLILLFIFYGLELNKFQSPIIEMVPY